MKQILIVEDDSFLNKMLDYNLTADGYGVTSALNARTAADAIRQREFDLVLLDINLPDGNGFELCKLIKPQHPDTIVIFLTANDQESDQIRGYEVGAVDYITKPFDPVEVLARVRSQLRRYTQLGSKKEEEKANVYTVGPIVLDEEKKSVTVDGDEVALTPIEFNILRLLMKNPGRIYSSAQIYELVWKEDSLGAETSVSVHIRHLRQKLEINPSEPRYLKVVWGLGYKMEDKK